MSDIRPTFRPEDSLRVGRDRDARLRVLLEEHPVTAALLVAHGWFSTANKARARLRRLAQRGRARRVGTLDGAAGGRPEHVYCRWRPRPETLVHEIELTEVCLKLDARTLRRGPAVIDREVRPDAEAEIGGETYYVELDRGTMGRSQLARRFRLYADCPHFSLWVCSTPARRDALRAMAAPLRRTALFTTLDEARRGPHTAVWWDASGGCVRLPRASLCRP